MAIEDFYESYFKMILKLASYFFDLLKEVINKKVPSFTRIVDLTVKLSKRITNMTMDLRDSSQAII
jgi:hypothetical protein